MRRLQRSMSFGALLALVAVAGQGVTALAAPSPSPSPLPGKAQGVAAEQSRAAVSGRALGLDSGEKLVVKDVITDRDGTTNVRYDRTFDGLRVIGGDFVSHRAKSGKIKSVSWNGPHQVAVASTTPKLSLASAKSVGLRKASLVQETTSATKGELVVYASGSSARATPRLAYDVLTTGVRADQTPSRLHTIADAGTGATLASWDEIESGTGHGVHVGDVTIGTTKVSPTVSSWTMRDATGNYVTDLNGVEDQVGTVPGTTFTSTTDDWGNGTVSDRASAAVDAQYGAEQTFDFYKNVLGRNGIWNTGVGARSRVHYGTGYENAFWDGTQMSYGDGLGDTHPLTELDVAGHEMTHGVTGNTARLLGTGETGGLNEATSDIFGTAVEFKANNPADTPDYLIGELIDLNHNGTPLRYMDRPSRDGSSPDCWSSTLGALDEHDSAGPLNHWFYLASEGSGAKVINSVPYNSPTCNASTVASIGRDKVEKIWYRALSVYLTSGSGYAAAREAAIQSAKDLYGVGSAPCVGVAAAFSAISVPPGAQTCGIKAPPPLGRNLLANPGFESGNILWSGTPEIINQGGGPPTHSGTWKAWLGGYGLVNHDSISQLVTIPAGTQATVSYYVLVATDETTTTRANDTMKVRAGSRLLQTLSNLNAASGGYQLKTINLSAYAGRTTALSFSSDENASHSTSFVLDDLAVNAAPRTIFSPLDFTGDGKSDVLRVTPNGDLYLYRGNGLGGFAGAGVRIGVGWGGFVKLFSPGDFTGDGRSDVLAANSNGELYLYRGNGLGRFAGAGVRIGVHWSGFVKLFSPGDFTGDGRSDVLATKSNGELYLYRGNGLGRFSGSGVRIGIGWGGFEGVFSPRDFTGDGRSDILAVKPNGELYLYRGNGLGGFAGSGARVGTGF